MWTKEKSTIIKPGKPSKITKKEYKKKEYINHFTKLVELERKEEMQRHKREMKQLSGRQRQKKGRAILNLRGRDRGMGLGGKFLVKFVRKKGLPETEINVGDLIRISKNKPLSENNPSGTVIKKTNYSITASFGKKLPKWGYKKIRIDLYVNDITYQRMIESIKKIADIEGEQKDLIKKILAKKELENIDTDQIHFFNKKLNASQKKAVKKAVKQKDLHLIHGPPGTGKTVTCVEVIEQAINKQKKILACADSNTAVDNLVDHLAKKDRKVVRVGHPARVTPVLREHTLDFIVEDNKDYKKAKSLRQKAYSLKDKQEKYTYPSGRWRRGLSNKAIKSLAKKQKGSRGIPPSKIKEMAKSISIQEKIDSLFKKIDYLEEKAVKNVIENADIVCTTNSSAASRPLEKHEFDVCIIDEATQATEPSCLIPIVKSKKVVMAGDHKQLPPTVLNQKAEEKGLGNTLFERIIALYDNKVKTMLNLQYRMNEKIMGYPSVSFYNGKLKADESVRKHTINDLIKNEGDFKAKNDLLRKICFSENPLVLIDTNGKMSEENRYGSTSKQNPGEGKIVEKIIDTFLQNGLNPFFFGVITPYDDQKKLLMDKIQNRDVEIDTVDGYQGREKEIIILSLTRSNKKNNIGFLKDLRRLNVAITRPKRKLIVIADTDTISKNQVYSNLFGHIEKKGMKICI
ncbi:MAG: IGHMBP2 family helicase [Candidatus Thermoplasmatota archaeon]